MRESIPWYLSMMSVIEFFLLGLTINCSQNVKKIVELLIILIGFIIITAS